MLNAAPCPLGVNRSTLALDAHQLVGGENRFRVHVSPGALPCGFKRPHAQPQLQRIELHGIKPQTAPPGLLEGCRRVMNDGLS